MSALSYSLMILSCFASVSRETLSFVCPITRVCRIYPLARLCACSLQSPRYPLGPARELFNSQGPEPLSRSLGATFPPRNYIVPHCGGVLGENAKPVLSPQSHHNSRRRHTHQRRATSARESPRQPRGGSAQNLHTDRPGPFPRAKKFTKATFVSRNSYAYTF